MTEPWDDPTVVAEYDRAGTALQDLTDVDLRLVDPTAPPVHPDVIEWPRLQYTGIPVKQPTHDGFTAAADVHEGAMIAFIPSLDDLKDLVIDGGEPLEELHITAAYLGKADEIDVDARSDIIAAMMDLATRQPVIVANVFGFGVFNPNGPEPAVIANVGGDTLSDAHDSVLVTLDELDFDLEEQHEPWVAHLTLVYPTGDPYESLTDELTAKTGLITIDTIRVAFGGVITDIPLGHDALTAAHVFHLQSRRELRADVVITSSGYNEPPEDDDALPRGEERELPGG